jgi:hypothetical protein
MKLEIDVPEKLNEISVEQYQRYVKLLQENELSEFTTQKTVEIFCKLKLSEVAKISYNSVNEIIDHLNDLFTQEHKLVQTFKIKDTEFGFIPNLEKMTFGEFVDLENYIYKTEDYHKAMAVLYRPVTKKSGNLYEVFEYRGTEEFSDLMKYAPLDALLGALVFFCDLATELRNASKHYLSLVEAQMTEQEKQTLRENGDGINPFTQLHEAMSYDLGMSLNFKLLKH